MYYTSTILYYIVVYYIILYYTTLHYKQYTILYYTILYYTILYHTLVLGTNITEGFYIVYSVHYDEITHVTPRNVQFCNLCVEPIT